ncbi:MAG: adenylate cyclase [Oceanicoccus sp.]
MSKTIKKILAGLALSVLVTLVSVLFTSIELLESQNSKLTHSLYQGRELSDEIVIVAIDDLSLSSLNSPFTWPLNHYGQTLDHIYEGDPAVVMIDVLFTQETTSIPQESIAELFQQELQTNEFIFEVLSYLQSPNPFDQEFVEVLYSVNNLFLAKAVSGDEVFNGESYEYTNPIVPAELFSDAAHTAYVSTSASTDETVYGIPELLTVNGVTEKHMDFQIVENYLNKDLNDVPLEEGNLLINYAQPSFSYPMYSLVDVYNGTLDSSIFEDKIVLIGATAEVLHDQFVTPIDSELPMPGIEIHANAIQTLLDQEFLGYQDTAAFIGLVAVIVLASVFAFLYLPIWGGLVVLIAEIAVFPFYAQWRFDKGVIINLIWPVFAMVTAYLLVMAYRNFTEFREKRALRNAFSHYVSPELVKQISESGDDLELGGERRIMTTLFLDIENFTGLSEKLEPHEVVKIINIYFDAFAKEIMAHGGTVDKFEGDAIMALFGAPIKSADHALKACQTAMAIRSRISALNEQTGHNLNVRLGIATGECIVGNMGSESRFDYTAMGDTVNTASRLEGGNKFYGTRILVNPGTMEASQESLFFRRIDRVKLKGKDEAIDIYELMGTQEAVSDAGKLVVNEWHSALEYYRNQDWDNALEKIRLILEKLPNDGPAQTYIKRIEQLKISPPETWDGTWRFTSK